MITSYAPQIARVAEETVLNLKELEGRIEVLKNDLAVLCTTIGHPEAARLAVTPARWLGPEVRGPGIATPFASPYGHLAPHLLGNPLQGTFGTVSPLTGYPNVAVPGMNPWLSAGIAGPATPYSPFQAPFATPFATPFGTPFATPFGAPLATPFATPFAGPVANPYAAATPFAGNVATPGFGAFR